MFDCFQAKNVGLLCKLLNQSEKTCIEMDGLYFSSKNICHVCDNIQISFYLEVSTIHFMLNVHDDLDLLTL